MNFDLDRTTTGMRVLAVSALLLFIDLFLDWQKVCVGAGGFNVCGARSGWHGAAGVLLGLLTIALLVWLVADVLNLLADVMLPVPNALITAGLAALVLLFTLIKFFSANEARHWPAWIGLLLGIAVGVGGWLRFSEGDATARTAPPAAEPPPAA